MTLASIPTIPEYYSRKNIFITGATGFLGKALIEKLLRSCPNVGTMYVLIRPKRGKLLEDRVKEFTSDPVFDRIKREQPHLKMEQKVIPLAGDVADINLGLSPEDRQIIMDNVHIIFHIAASVRFDDTLTDAVMMNVRGTREACQLALDTKHLEAHIHVSTAFANCDRPEAKEILYNSKIDWKRMISIAETYNKDTLNILTEKFMDGMPNTYCFTKNIAEHVAFDMMNGKKTCKIFRPSIVISSLNEEPVRGWIDNFNGPIGIMLAYGKGIMRTMYANSKYKPDYIPIDVVTKALIVSTWDIAIRKPPVPEVMHCTAHEIADWLRPSIEQLTNLSIAVNKTIPLNGIMWVPSSHTTTSTVIWYIRTLLFMLLPAFAMDGILKMLGKKPMLIKLQKKMFIAQLALRHFMTNEWKYDNENLILLQNKILSKDKPDWDYEFRNTDFSIYLEHAILGCRRYLLKETDDTLPQAIKHYKTMAILDTMMKIFGLLLVMWFIWKIDVMQYGFQKIIVLK